MQPIALTAPVGPSGPARRQDVYALKAGLSRIGEYRPRRGVGMTGTLDRDTVEGVKRVQRRFGLPATGTVRPDDGLVDALNSEAARRGKLYRPALSRAFLDRLERDATPAPRRSPVGQGPQRRFAPLAPAAERHKAPNLLTERRRGGFLGTDDPVAKPSHIGAGREPGGITRSGLAMAFDAGAEANARSNLLDRPGSKPRRRLGKQSLPGNVHGARPDIDPLGPPRGGGGVGGMIGGGGAGAALGTIIGEMIGNVFDEDAAAAREIEERETAKQLSTIHFLRPFLPNVGVENANDGDEDANPSAKRPYLPDTGSPTGPEDPDPGGPGGPPELPPTGRGWPYNWRNHGQREQDLNIEEVIQYALENGGLLGDSRRALNVGFNAGPREAIDLFDRIGLTNVRPEPQQSEHGSDDLYVGQLDVGGPEPLNVILRRFATYGEEPTVEVQLLWGRSKVAIRFVPNPALPDYPFLEP